MLATPEIVPFRLTRDLVDGMGVTGVQGTFTRCCQQTVRVLRAQYESVLTIVEVFLHDPLYAWALSPAKVRSPSSQTNESNSCFALLCSVLFCSVLLFRRETARERRTKRRTRTLLSRIRWRILMRNRHYLD